ncbi:hypothetical protein DYH09_11825 [bacterium CPR1]|nr:hypothetical protein [bacterium CPR1]
MRCEGGFEVAFSPQVLGQAEVVLLQGMEHAAVLAYTPGETPVTLAAVRGKEVEELLWCAQEMNLPLVDVPLEEVNLSQFPIDEEIPEPAYRVVAQCLALVQRARPGPTPVRLLRSVGKLPTGLRKRLACKAGEVLGQLEVARVALQVGSDSDSAELREAMLKLALRLELELGIILSDISLRVLPELTEGQFRLALRDVVVSQGQFDIQNLDSLLRDIARAVEQNAWRLLGYRETEALLDNLRKTHSGLVKELFPQRFSLTSLRVILRNLLREGISIRDLASILEALVEFRGHSQDPDQLTEFVRSSFSHFLCAKFSDDEGVLHALILEPSAERSVLAGLRESSSALWLDLDLDTSLKILTSVSRGLQRAGEIGVPVVVLCSPRPRRFLRRLIEPSFPMVAVLAYSEVAPLAEVRTFGLIGT